MNGETADCSRCSCDCISAGRAVDGSVVLARKALPSALGRGPIGKCALMWSVVIGHRAGRAVRCSGRVR